MLIGEGTGPGRKEKGGKGRVPERKKEGRSVSIKLINLKRRFQTSIKQLRAYSAGRQPARPRLVTPGGITSLVYVQEPPTGAGGRGNSSPLATPAIGSQTLGSNNEPHVRKKKKVMAMYQGTAIIQPLLAPNIGPASKQGYHWEYITLITSKASVRAFSHIEAAGEGYTSRGKSQLKRSTISTWVTEIRPLVLTGPKQLYWACWWGHSSLLHNSWKASE